MKVLSFIRQRSFARFIMFDLADAARRIGWSAEWLDLEGRLFETSDRPRAHKERVVDGTVQGIEEVDPDLVFSYGLEYLDKVFEAYLPDRSGRFLDYVSRPAVFFFCDFGPPLTDRSDPAFRPMLSQLQHWNSLVMCWDREVTATLRRLGVTRARDFPLAVNDRMFYPPEPDVTGKAIPILFVGGPSADRIRMLEPLADRGLVIYGYDAAGWARSPALAACYRGELRPRDDLRAAYQRARISVNVTRPHGPASLNMRVFEAMACGSMVLTDDRSDATTLFTEDKEIAIYRDRHDLERKVGRYLTQTDTREAVGRAGRRRVETSHTYTRRLGAAEAAIVQFHRESRILTRLEDFVRTDPAKALRFIRYLAMEGAIEHDRESLRLLEARTHLALGDPARATASLADLAELNPHHVAAARCRRQVEAVTARRSSSVVAG